MSAFALKLIALDSMLYDHLTALWPLEIVLWIWFFPQAETLPGWAETLCDLSPYIGRIAAPIFLWSIAQGYRHTRDWKRYALRLLVFACLAEWPYYLLFEGHGNIIFTQLVGLLTLRAMDWGNEKRLGLGYLLAALSVALSWYFAVFEGNGRYVLFILVFYLTDHWPVGKRALLWLFLYPASRWKLLYLYFTEGFHLRMFFVNGFGPLLGVGLTLCCNGEKGPERKGLKYLWYTAYPAHLLLLALWKLCRGY